MIRVGDTVGGYEIVSRLSAGGMATLFLARRRGASGFHRHVAIKVVHEHLASDPMFVQMFVDEALLSSRIQHPNIVHIEELRELDHQHFLVMEYVKGVSLMKLLKRLSRSGKRMTPELAVYLAIQIADGLHAAHELKDDEGQLEGVVHRDVIPQNVLIAWEGHVKLIDFGVAKARSRMQQTTGASLKGKLRYMAPEQAKGAPVDRRTDVYALGIVLWEMLSMRRRFFADNDFALLEQVRSATPTPPSEHNSNVSVELDRIVERAMARDMADRYETAQDFRRALASALPSALALDASHLGDFIRAVCERDLRHAQTRLPPSLELPAVLDIDVEGVSPFGTMAISASQILDYAGDSSSVSLVATASTCAASPSAALRKARDSRAHASRVVSTLAVLLVMAVLGGGLATLTPGAGGSLSQEAAPGAPSDVTSVAQVTPSPARPPRGVSAGATDGGHLDSPDGGVARDTGPTAEHPASARRPRHRSAVDGRTGPRRPTGRSGRTHSMGMRIPIADDFGF